VPTVAEPLSQGVGGGGEPCESAEEGGCCALQAHTGAHAATEEGGGAEGGEPESGPDREGGDGAGGQAAQGCAGAVALDEEDLAGTGAAVAGAEGVPDEGIVDKANAEAAAAGAQGEVEVFAKGVEVGVEATRGVEDLAAEEDGRAGEGADFATGGATGVGEGATAFPGEVEAVEEQAVAGVVDALDAVGGVGEHDAGLVDAGAVGGERADHGGDEVGAGFGVVVEDEDGAITDVGKAEVRGGREAGGGGAAHDGEVGGFGGQVDGVGVADGHDDVCGRVRLGAEAGDGALEPLSAEAGDEDGGGRGVGHRSVGYPRRTPRGHESRVVGGRVSGSTFGRLFRVTTFGESHGGALGVVVDGCPAGLELDLDAVRAALARRRPGTSKFVTARKETDAFEVLSGVFDGRTLGTPLSMVVRNKDADPRSYKPFADRYRPSHADFVYDAKHGFRTWQGGGRASARETVARVAAGAVAEQVLQAVGPVELVAWVDRLGGVQASVDPATVSRAAVDRHPLRCPDADAAERMVDVLQAARKDGDTVGGVVRCVVRGVPAGLGEPVFDKLEAALAGAMLSIPAAKGFESGSGYAGVDLRGRDHNDVWEPDGAGGARTRSNHSGGIQGGISNGMPIAFSVAFKPVATVFFEQETVDDRGRAATVKPKGRHDPCVVQRAVPIVEAMAALVLVDALLVQRSRAGLGTTPAVGQWPWEGRE